MSKRFGYAIDKRYLPFLLPFGLRGSKDGVTLTDEGSLLATFGFIKIKTRVHSRVVRDRASGQCGKWR